MALARWLAAEPTVLILDEPTQGVDVGAKAEIHRLMGELAARGMAIVMISSELPEILGMSDRIAVMHGGAVVGVARPRRGDAGARSWSWRWGTRRGRGERRWRHEIGRYRRELSVAAAYAAAPARPGGGRARDFFQAEQLRAFAGRATPRSWWRRSG